MQTRSQRLQKPMGKSQMQEREDSVRQSRKNPGKSSTKAQKQGSRPKQAEKQRIEATRETRETKFISTNYLSKVAKPTFHHFSTTLSNEIAVYSVKLNSENAFKLMAAWINFYNRVIRLYKTPQTSMQKTPNTVSTIFKSIFKLTNTLKSNKDQLISESIERSAAYINKAGSLLQQVVQVDEDDGAVQFDEGDGAVQVDEGAPIHAGSLGNVDEEVEPDDNEPDYDKVRSDLIHSLNNYLTTKKFTPVTYEPSGKRKHIEALLEEACSITQSKTMDDIDISFLKLSLSSSVNLVQHAYRKKYAAVLPKDYLDSLYARCSTRSQSLISIDIAIEATIDTIFEAMKPFQFDAAPDRLISWIDLEKAQEADKHCDKYNLLKIIDQCVTSFATLNKTRDSEAMYCGIVRSLLEILFKGTDLEVIDGDNVSSSTQRMSIINQCDVAEFGRRVDLMVYESYDSNEVEYSSIEFKTALANAKLLDYQQAKNIRINATILNDLIALTKNSNRGCLYFDWFGGHGYLVEVFRYSDIFVAHHLGSLNLPLSTLEIDEFRKDLKLLYKWRQHLVQTSQLARLELVRNKRKFDTISVSSPTTPNTSPHRSPVILPVDIFFSPSKTKKSKQ